MKQTNALTDYIIDGGKSKILLNSHHSVEIFPKELYERIAQWFLSNI